MEKRKAAFLLDATASPLPPSGQDFEMLCCYVRPPAHSLVNIARCSRRPAQAAGRRHLPGSCSYVCSWRVRLRRRRCVLRTLRRRMGRCQAAMENEEFRQMYFPGHNIARYFPGHNIARNWADQLENEELGKGIHFPEDSLRQNSVTGFTLALSRQSTPLSLEAVWWSMFQHPTIEVANLQVISHNPEASSDQQTPLLWELVEPDFSLRNHNTSVSMISNLWCSAFAVSVHSCEKTRSSIHHSGVNLPDV